jgi:hypothetical protein
MQNAERKEQKGRKKNLREKRERERERESTGPDLRE